MQKIFMRLAVLSLTFLMTMVQATENSACDSISAVSEEWFAWGEYELIRSELPQCLNSASEYVVPRHFLYLGVALYTAGEIQKSQESFIRAYELDSALAFDYNYVSAEILEFYQTTIRDYKEITKARSVKDSLARLHALEAALNRKMVDSISSVQLQRKRQRAAVLSVSGISIAVAGSVVGYLEYRNANEAFSEYQRSAALGNLEKYKEYRVETVLHDRTSIVSFVISGLSAAISGYFVYKYVSYRTQSKNKR